MPKKNGKKERKRRAAEEALLAPGGAAGGEASPFEEDRDDTPAGSTPMRQPSATGWVDTSPMTAPAAAPRGAACLSTNDDVRAAAPAGQTDLDSAGLVLLSPAGCYWLAGYLAAASLFFLYGVASSWPEASAADPDSSLESSLLLLTLYAGGLGACVHALQSFTTFVGNRRLGVSWVPWYMLRPLIGMSLAFMAYVIVRVGLLQTSATDVNPAGVAAIGGLAGLFAKRALQKLSEVSETVFRVQNPPEEKDTLSPRSPAGPGDTPRF